MTEMTRRQLDEARRWVVQKRVANTEQWKTVALAGTRAGAEKLAREVTGGTSTGVRILDDHAEYGSPGAEPVLIRGC